MRPRVNGRLTPRIEQQTRVPLLDEVDQDLAKFGGADWQQLHCKLLIGGTSLSAERRWIALPHQGPYPASHSRPDETYRQRALIAECQAKGEPHSPRPCPIKGAVEWAQKPLRDLLTKLITAGPESRRQWTLPGVLPEPGAAAAASGDHASNRTR